jgi:hypothetical protein
LLCGLRHAAIIASVEGLAQAPTPCLAPREASAVG